MFFRRRIWWFVLLAVTAIALISQQVFIDIPSQAQNAQTRTFDNPSIGGQRLDRCLTWERKCGAPAAKAFCQLNKYSELVGFGVDNSPKITQVISDGRVCQEGVNHPNCDGFKWITCSNNSSNNIAEKIISSIKEKGNFSTKDIPNTDHGRKACLAAVNEVLKNAGIEPLDHISVLEAKAALDNGRGTPVDASNAKPGDIVLVDINGQHHIGFCQNNGCSQTISNSSSKASFSFKGNGNFSYKGSPYNGSAPNIYRLNR
ncbi:MAG: hypothetical protein KME30_31340 [Iphinoe sp. HA4291-MV1]|nr:hypothetical protein [Iphinoe sp. HA4291-MV1]